MLTLVKVLVVLTWLVMVLLVIFAPSGPRRGEAAVILHASDWGSEVEREFRHTLKTLPPQAQLMIVDDGLDAMGSQVLEKLIVSNPGVIGVRTR